MVIVGMLNIMCIVRPYCDYRAVKSLCWLGIMVLWLLLGGRQGFAFDVEQVVVAASSKNPNGWRHQTSSVAASASKDYVRQDGSSLDSSADEITYFTTFRDMETHFSEVISLSRRVVYYEGISSEVIARSLVKMGAKNRLLSVFFHVGIDKDFRDELLKNSIVFRYVPWVIDKHPLLKTLPAHLFPGEDDIWIKKHLNQTLQVVLLVDRELYLGYRVRSESGVIFPVRKSHRAEDLRLFLDVYRPYVRTTLWKGKPGSSQKTSIVGGEGYDYSKKHFRKPSGVSRRLPSKLKPQRKSSMSLKTKSKERSSGDAFSPRTYGKKRTSPTVQSSAQMGKKDSYLDVDGASSTVKTDTTHIRRVE